MFSSRAFTILVFATILIFQTIGTNSEDALNKFRGKSSDHKIVNTGDHGGTMQGKRPHHRRQASAVLPSWIASQLPGLCPPLESPRLELSCMLGRNTVPCQLPMSPGTVAIERCKEFFNDRCQLESYSLKCRQGGQWDYPLFHCTPGDACKRGGSNGGNGTWTRISQCGRDQRTSRNCDIIYGDPYVCCVANRQNKPPVNPRPEDRKSTRMCRKYAAPEFLSVTSPNEVRPDRINTCTLVEPIDAPAPTGYDHVPDLPRNTLPREFPHTAVLGYGAKNYKRPALRCAGSLVSERYVLSLARCANTPLGPAAWARLGDYNINTDSDDVKRDSRTVFYDIIEVIVHPEYRYKHEPNEIFYHDIALYKLYVEVKFNAYVRPICLHTGDRLDNIFAITTGWGPVEIGGRPSDVVQKVNVTIVEDGECSDAYKFYGESKEGVDTKLSVCAALVDGRDTCTRIDGSPLQVRLRDPHCMYSLVGLAYFGNSCFVKTPGVYVRVSYYLDWIESIVWP